MRRATAPFSWIRISYNKDASKVHESFALYLYIHLESGSVLKKALTAIAISSPLTRPLKSKLLEGRLSLEPQRISTCIRTQHRGLPLVGDRIATLNSPHPQVNSLEVRHPIAKLLVNSSTDDDDHVALNDLLNPLKMDREVLKATLADLSVRQKTDFDEFWAQGRDSKTPLQN